MANLKDIVAFILREYPYQSELSNARVTKMVYLADWHQAINFEEQISNIQWYFDNFGPFVRDIEEMASQNKDLFEVEYTQNAMGSSKKLFRLKDRNYIPVLTRNEELSLRHVIEATKDKGWGAFIKLVYSTHPISSSVRYTNLDLVAKAKDYGTSGSAPA